MSNRLEFTRKVIFQQDIDGQDNSVTSSFISDFSEAVDDRVYGLLVAGNNVQISYNDSLNKLTISSTNDDADTLDGESGEFYLDWNNFINVPSTFPPSPHTHTTSDVIGFGEAIDDKIYSLLVAGSNISLSYDDVNNTLVINSLGITSVDASIVAGLSEAIDDEVYSLLTAGTNITLNYNDTTNKLTINASTEADTLDGRHGSFYLNWPNFTNVPSELTNISETIDDEVYSLLTAGTNITLSYNDALNKLTINSKGDPAILSNFAAYPDLGSYGRWFEVDSTDLWGDGRIPFSITINKSDSWFNIPTAIYPLTTHGFPPVKANFSRRYKISIQASGTTRAIYSASDPNWNNGRTTGHFWLMLYDVATSSVYYSVSVGTFDDETKYLKLFTVDLPADIDLTKKYQVKLGIFWDNVSASWPTQNQGGDSILNNYNNYGQDCALEIHTMTLVAYDVMPS